MTRATIENELESFLANRNKRFPNVTDEQKKRWADNIEKFLGRILEDNDTLYDSRPDDVQALMHEKVG